MTPPFPNSPSNSPTTADPTEDDGPLDTTAPGPRAMIHDPARPAAQRKPPRSWSAPAHPGHGDGGPDGGAASSLTEQTADRSPVAADAARASSEVSSRDRARPEPVLENLALSAIEVIAGARDLEQLGRWVTREVYEHLSIRVTVASRARRVRGAVGKRPVILGTRVSAFRTGDAIVDGVVTVTMRDRTRAVALRIEWERGRWRATAIHVL